MSKMTLKYSYYYDDTQYRHFNSSFTHLPLKIQLLMLILVDMYLKDFFVHITSFFLNV